MPRKTYHVCLSPEKEKLLKDITHKGNSHSAKKILHANILLPINECYPDKRRSNQEVADIFGVSKTTLNQIRKTYEEHGLEAALTRKTRLTPPVASKITGDLEAHVLANALSSPLEDHPYQPGYPASAAGLLRKNKFRIHGVKQQVSLCLANL